MLDISHADVRIAICRALDEDIGSGDVTSELTIASDLRARGRFIAKQQLVLAGVDLIPVIYEIRGGAEVEALKKDGAIVQSGEIIALVRSRARTLLECERVALNFLQRLSGVATLARKYVEAAAGTGVRILDTRKTTPGLRELEKYAAAAGGAINHRRGLFDAVLIKNNHIAAAGGVERALERTKAYRGAVEIEVRTRAELDEALAWGAKRLLLDNLTPAEAADWIRHIRGRASVELSGGIKLENIGAYAEAGPDFISCGAITHSATAVDISFQLELEQQ